MVIFQALHTYLGSFYLLHEWASITPLRLGRCYNKGRSLWLLQIRIYIVYIYIYVFFLISFLREIHSQKVK